MATKQTVTATVTSYELYSARGLPYREQIKVLKNARDNGGLTLNISLRGVTTAALDAELLNQADKLAGAEKKVKQEAETVAETATETPKNAAVKEIELSPKVEFVDVPEFRADGTEIELSPEVESEPAPDQYSLASASDLLTILPSDFELSLEFLALINAQETQATVSPVATKQVDLLLDEHPDSAIAVFGLTESQTGDLLRRIINLGGKWRRLDSSWRFPFDVIARLKLDFPEPEYIHTSQFKKAFEFNTITHSTRIDFLNDAESDEQIAVYAPHSHIPTKLAIVKLKAHYVSDDRSWRFPLSLLSEVIEAFPEGDYQYSEAFKKAVTFVTAPPRVDLLRDEHPDRCIVVSGFTDADEYFKCKVSHLDGVYNESDNTWRFCLDTLPLLLAYFPSPDYTHSETLLDEFKPIECGF